MSDAAPLDPFLTGGHPLHTRTLVIDVAAAAPGQIRAHGTILDLRKCGFVPTGGDLQTAGFVHHMELDALIDSKHAVLQQLDVSQPIVAMEPSSATGGECCRDPAPLLQALVGQPVAGDFAKRLGRAFGGPLGCSHLLTLGQLLGSTIPRLLAAEALENAQLRETGERVWKRALFLDGFEAADGRMDLAIQLSEFQTRPRCQTTQPLERLALQHEVRVTESVDLAAMTVLALDASERQRDIASLGTAPWRSRKADLAPLVGGPALRGMAARLFERFGSETADRALLDALLNLAPGQIQSMASLANRMMERFKASSTDKASVPNEFSVGGMADSCYMWRSDGASSRLRAEYTREED